jgi:hypothetical protein
VVGEIARPLRNRRAFTIEHSIPDLHTFEAWLAYHGHRFPSDRRPIETVQYGSILDQLELVPTMSGCGPPLTRKGSPECSTDHGRVQCHGLCGEEHLMRAEARHQLNAV